MIGGYARRIGKGIAHNPECAWKKFQDKLAEREAELTKQLETVRQFQQIAEGELNVKTD